jgi:hydrogenase-4 component B
MVVAAVGALLAGGSQELISLSLLPSLGEMHFRLDSLSAFFVLLIGGLGVAGSIYAIGYTAGHGTSGERYAPLLGGLWNLFIASMAAVVLAGDGLSFLFGWELMSVVSFMLVMAEHRDPEVRQAGYFYVVMTHLGTAFLVGAFLALFAKTGSLDFAAFKAAAPGLSGGLRNGLFVALVVGFGTKAGLVPLHVWLPRAHPAAPSHVSALMSGAMVKTAVYGMLRFSFDVLGGGPSWWGSLLIVAGLLSAVTGVAYATQQSHLKRLLAYSTVENVGFLFMGTGAALWAKAVGHPAIALLALGAVLFHAMSHAAFKGLAFMGAGAVLHGAGTVDIEKLGGLIRRMPKAAAFFLVAAMAVAGLPPLSGFIGEWLSLQTFFQLARAGQGFVDRMVALAGVAAIALAAGLAAAAAVKAFGITFLALPRSEKAEHAHDAGPMMLAGMGLLAAVVVALGFFPGLILRPASAVAATLLPGTGAAGAGLTLGGGTLLSVLSIAPGTADGVAASLSSLAAPAAVVLLAGLTLLLTVWLGKGWVRYRRDITWTCGIEPNARMEYSGQGYTKVILLMFKGLLQPVRTLEVDKTAHPLFPGRVHYESELAAVFELQLYRPVTHAVMEVASQLRRLQTGSLQTYLLYLLLAAVGLIVAAR